MIDVGSGKRWKFIHKRANGTWVGQLDRIFAWDCSRAENEKGSFSLTIPPDYVHDFMADDIIEFWRSLDAGRSFSLVDDTCWFVRDAELAWDGSKETIVLSGHDTTGLLERRIVAWFSVVTNTEGINTYSKKHEPSDAVVWDLFYENFGAGVTAAPLGDVPPSAGGAIAAGAPAMLAVRGDRIMLPVMMEGRTEAGPVIDLECSWKNVLSSMKDAAKASAQLDQRLVFDIFYDPNSATPFVFRVCLGCRGVNRVTAAHPVVFSLEHENVSKISLKRIFSDEETWVHVGGSGQGALRITQGVIAEVGAYKRSPFYPVEAFVENTKTANYNDLKTLGDAELFRKRARYTFSAEARDVAWTVYGRDYKLGDIVAAQHRGVTGNCLVSKSRFSLKNGIESLSIPLESSDDLSA